MKLRKRIAVALAAAALIGFAASAEARALMIAAAPKPAVLAGQSDIVVIGKVVEVEKDSVEATQFKGAPQDQKIPYKIAVVKIEEALIGGKGLTQFRVGFPESATTPQPPGPPGGGQVRAVPRRPGAAPVALTVGTEGVFFLAPHHGGDFYVLAYNGMGAPLSNKDENYKKELEQIKKVAKTIEDPVAALKAKGLSDRYEAAGLMLRRYQMSSVGGGAREAIPAEENKLILAVMKELPWQPVDAKPRTGSDPIPPCRSALWNMLNPNELGYQQPKFPPRKAGDPPVDYNKIMDESTAKFLKDNADKIKLKRFVK